MTKNIDYTYLIDVENKIDEFYDIDEKEAIKLYKMFDTLKEFMEEPILYQERYIR